MTITFEDRVQVRDCLKGRVKDPSLGARKSRRVTFTVGASYWRAEQKWVHREMYVDRDRGQYREVVSDPESGEIIYRREEPLKNHRGHGNAKPGRSTDEED